MATGKRCLSSLTGRFYTAASSLLTRLFVSYKTFRGNGEAFFWKEREWCGERLVDLPEPRVLFHGASVGEITGIIPVMKCLDEMGFSGSMILSTGTPTGFRKALALSGKRITAVPAPLDAPSSVRNFFNSLKPSLYVLFEADYWPVTLLTLAERSIPAILCNGRISSSSFRLYRALRGLFRGVFSHFSWMAVVQEEDRRRAIFLGADPGKVEVLGSTKYDRLVEYVNRRSEVSEAWRRRLRIAKGVPVIVAGSLRGRECRAVGRLFVKLFDEFQDLVCILAPRHEKRIEELERECYRPDVPVQRLSACLDSSKSGSGEVYEVKRKIIIVDTVGHLFELYSLADLAFCGGTFEKIGGHNIVEPVVWGCPVVFGPHVFKVSREARLLERMGAGIRLETLSALYFAVRRAIGNPGKGKLDEALVQTLMTSLTGVSKICAGRIMEILY